MPHYKPFHPDHMVLGQNILAHERAINSEDVQPYFEKHGLTNLDPRGWYPQQKLLDVMNEMAARGDRMFDFVAIGMKLVEDAIMPPAFNSLPLIDVLRTANEAYKLNNRGTDIGEIKCDVVDDKHVKIILRMPGPDDYWYGIAYGYMRRFAPAGTNFSLYYDKNVPRHALGGAETIIHIIWE